MSCTTCYICSYLNSVPPPTWEGGGRGAGVGVLRIMHLAYQKGLLELSPLPPPTSAPH